MKIGDWLRLQWYRPSFMEIGSHTRIFGRLFLEGTCNFHVGDRCKIKRYVRLATHGDGKLVLGDDVIIGEYAVINANELIQVGSGTGMGEFTAIFDANHGTARGTHYRKQVLETAPVLIGRDAWIGRNVCILKGVTIGDGCVIGANSVVTQDIPAHCIAAGVPAKVIRERE